MKRSAVRFALMALALTISLSAFAKPKSEKITLYHDASVNGTNLPAGDYLVKYDVEGSNAQVTFTRGGKEVASATGQVKTLDKKAASNQVVMSDQDRSISEIEFGGKDTAITFAATGAATGK